ncbi:MAG: hypothetical protein GEU98_18180 [Pseudonocardiaceae bacterium]|nr:hypothetical protein [Pseudonocardiaceae bacterium]
MSDHRGWHLPESHLLPDAIVAFVDGELSPSAQDRASAHVASCPSCAADVRAQRQASGAVRSAKAPSVSAGLLANLRAIPQHVDVPSSPDGLAMSGDGQLVAIQRPERVTPLGTGAPLGSSAPLGTSDSVLGGRNVARRATQGAGVVVSGLVLGALALVSWPNEGDASDEPMAGLRPAITGGVDMLQAGFGGAETTAPRTPAKSDPGAPKPADPAPRVVGANAGGAH